MEGKLNLDVFKRAIKYNLLTNGTSSLNVLQVHGRQKYHTNFKGRSALGIWFENFALPAVINECLMQSYNGTIRLFPNWPMEKDAEFNHLRAAGSPLKMILPWNKCVMVNAEGETNLYSKEIEISTISGEILTFKPVK